MHNSEHSPEKVSLLDTELAKALIRLEEVIDGSVHAAVGDEVYNEHKLLSALDDEVEDSLSEEAQQELSEHVNAMRSNAARAARQMLLEDDTPFDEDEERDQMQRVYLDEAVKMLPPMEESTHDLYTSTFVEITEALALEIGALLADRYPQIELVWVNEASITFNTQRHPVDAYSDTYLSISFQITGTDITTRLMYQTTPRSILGGEHRHEEVEEPKVDENIEGIALSALKKDTTQAIYLALETR